jgi:flagellar motor switch protein FliM
VIAEFPWRALPRVAAGEARASRALARTFGPALRARATAALAELFGQRVELSARRRAWLPCEPLDVGARGAIVVLEAAHGPIVLEIDAELALAAVGAMAGRKSLPKIARDRAIPDEIAGALAGIAQWVARACGIDAYAAGASTRPTAESARARLRDAAERAIVLDLAVNVGTLRGALRLCTNAPSFVEERSALAPLDVIRALGATPLALHLVAASGWLPAREVALLVRGDALVVDAAEGLARAGACVLAAASADAGVSVDRVGAWPAEAVRIGARRVGLAPEPGTVERGGLERTAGRGGPLASESSNSEATVEIAAIDDGGPLVEALADAPVLVRVEIGSVTLPAREWAAIGVGDVVALDRRVGDAVHLRVARRIIARGELVDVDGAIGVRVLERLP